MLAAVNAGDADTQAPPAYIEAMDANLTRNWAPLTGIVSGRVQADRSADCRSSTISTRDPRRGDEPVRARRRARAGARRAAPPALRRSSPAARRRASRSALDSDARQRLQALGYVTSTADPADAPAHRGRRPEDADAGRPAISIGRWRRSARARARERLARSARSSRRTRTSRPRTACSPRCSATPAIWPARSRRSKASSGAASPIRA